MNCAFKILFQLYIIKWGVAGTTYFHERSHIEIQLPDLKHPTDFGYSMGYSSKNNTLVIGAPHHDLNGKLFSCSMTDIFTKNTAVTTELHIELTGDYSRELAPDQNFCLGASIGVASDFILTCAPLWRSMRNNSSSMKFKYVIHGTCYVITDEKTERFKGAFEQIPEITNEKLIRKALRKVHGGSGWSTLIDEVNNITLISLAPFTETTDIGYINTIPPLDSMKFMNVYKEFNDVFKNMGTFTSGSFFEDKSLAYAFSSRRERMDGAVAFLQQPTKKKGKWEVMTRDFIPLYIEPLSSEIGTMFGAALSATDVNSDGYSDLLVGAPAHGSTDYLRYDSGALHIFLGGNKQKIYERRTILATKSGGYFGKTIATKDIDGDELSEIFVSAPFEDSGSGAVYVFNGREIKNFVEKNNPFTVISLSDLKFTQRIRNTEYKSFGYSLQPLPDLDDNGCGELAVGAPNSGKVLLYRSIPTMLVNVSAEIDRDYVRERDQNCSIRVKINIQFPSKPVHIYETLSVTMAVVGNGVSIDGGSSFEQHINRNQSSYDKNITVIFTNEEPGLYIFNATVALNISDYLTNKVFDKSRIGLSPYCNLTAVVPINRRCKGEECVPILSSYIWFSGGDKDYTLGSSTKETVTVTILNKGNDTFDSCAKILIKGSEVLYINAEQESTNWYQYLLPKPFTRNASNTIKIQLDMSKQSNLDKRLQVKVALYNICNRGNSSLNEKDITFVLNTDELDIVGVPSERNVTDTDISDLKTELITDDHVYTVVNNGSVTWKSIDAEINIKKEKFITGYHISKVESLNCEEKEDNVTFKFSCNFDLEKFLKIVITLDIAKNMIKNSLINGRLNTSSSFDLYFKSNEDLNLNKVITTTFIYKSDASLGENKTLVIVAAVVLSLIILLALSFVLYKSGFFKNPDRAKLKELQHEVRKQSIKRPNPTEPVTNLNSGQNVEALATIAEQDTIEGHTANVVHATCLEQKTSEGHTTREEHKTSEVHKTGEEQKNTEGIKTNKRQEAREGVE